MKALAAILALFFLSLNTVPCSDDAGGSCSEEVHFHADSTDDMSGHQDMCSPFCHCHCCHTHINTISSFKEEGLSLTFSEPVDTYTDRKGKELLNTLLQPPQA